MVALPIKIGNEWTEMHVRFVHRRQSNAGSEKGRDYAVYINVAPALLGAICARMEYRCQKNLSVAMEFESVDTRAWFAARKNDIRKALLAIGLPSPQIEFLMASKARLTQPLEATVPGPAATIDLKV